MRTLSGTRAFYENGLPELLGTWPGGTPGSDARAITDAALRDAVSAIEALETHLEALLPAMKDPVATHEVNVLGTLNVLMAVRASGCRCLIAIEFATTSCTKSRPRRSAIGRAPLPQTATLNSASG